MRKPSAGSPERTALVLCPEMPYPEAGGGAIRTASILEYLGPRYALDVILFQQAGAGDPARSFPPGLVRDLQVIELPRHSKHPSARVARNAVRLLRGRPPLNDRFGGFERQLAKRLEGRRYDLAVAEHFWCAEYATSLARHAAATILDLHNIESAFYASSGACAAWPASTALNRFAGAARAMERRWLPAFSSILVTSKEDAARVRAVCPDANVCVYPNALRCVPQPQVPEEDVIAFSGNLEYGPNVSALRYFGTEVWPQLRARWPQLRWRIIGKNAHCVPEAVRRSPNVEIAGEVPDAIRALAAARLVVVPLLAGSGTRIKILEAWAAARPVVSTGIGAEGLSARDREHLFLADDPLAFTDRVSELLASPAARQKVGAAGRKYYETDYTWNHVWEVLDSQGI